MAHEDSDLTVTSATRSVAEMQKDLGIEVDESDEKVAESTAPPADDADEPPPAGREVVVPKAPKAPEAVEREADSTKADEAVSEAARNLRAQRYDERTKRMQGEIDLLEDNIKRMGGTLAAIDVRDYPNKQAKLDHLTRIRHDRTAELNKVLKTPPTRQAAPVADPPPVAERGRAAGAPAAARPAAKPFEFPAFTDWQEKNPDKDFTDYTDARTDARYAYNDELKAAEQAATTQAQTYREGVTKAQESTAAFKATHADYDAVVSALRFDPESPQVQDIHRLLIKFPADAPGILYHLGKHPDELALLTGATAQSDLHMEFARIRTEARFAAKAASTTPAGSTAAASPAPASREAKPVSRTPAPAEELRGSTTRRRTLRELADEDDDADAYIAEVKRSEKVARTGG